MIKALVSDLSRVLLTPKDNNYAKELNALHKELSINGNYDFWAYFQINQDLLDFYKTLGEKINVYVFTTEHIQEHPSLQPKLDVVFKTIFSGAHLNLKKTDPQAYKTIAEKINLKTKEILYIDDKQINLDAAKKSGMVTILYETNKQTIKSINSLL